MLCKEVFNLVDCYGYLFFDSGCMIVLCDILDELMCVYMMQVWQMFFCFEVFVVQGMSENVGIYFEQIGNVEFVCGIFDVLMIDCVVCEESELLQFYEDLICNCNCMFDFYYWFGYEEVGGFVESVQFICVIVEFVVDEFEKVQSLWC